MSKKSKTLIIALGVLALLSGVYYWSIAVNRKKTDSKEQPYSPSLTIGNLKSYELVKIELNDMVLERKGEAWEYVSADGRIPKSVFMPDQAQINLLSYSLSSLIVEQVIDEAPSDLSQYGLDKPSSSAIVTDSNGRKAGYILGDMTPSRTSYYIMENGDAKVYSVSSYTAAYMQYTLDNIRRRTLFPDFEIQELTQFRIESGQNKIEIKIMPPVPKYEITAPFSNHLVTSPYKYPRGADIEAVNRLLRPFLGLEVADFIDDAPSSLKPYGLDAPLRIFLEAENESLDLMLGNGHDVKRYAKLAGSPEVFTLDGMEELVSVKAFSLIDKFALIINIESVERLSISGGEKNYIADFRGEGDDKAYYLNGRKTETDSFKTFYQAVIGLLLDAEYSGPALQSGVPGELTIEYRLNNPPGEPVAIALIPYNRDFYVLKQEGSAEFLISRNQVRRIYETADAVIYR